MKLLVVFVAIVASVIGGAIPLVPEKSLVDLQVPIEEESDTRNAADNQYWLFTRQNPTRAQIITHGSEQSIRASNYAGNRPLKVIIHGFAGNGNSDMNHMITAAWLHVMDANVIVVDWRRVASGSYVNAVASAPSLGRAVGNFVTWLILTAGGNFNNVHIAGFSLGGQIAGNAGRATNGRVGRVTGLDPVSPMWYSNANAIGRNDGQYVEIIHTYYERENSPLIGHADFYPNGGDGQPGCFTSICSHTRANELFASSIRTNHFIGRQCANWQQARNNQCTGATLRMGNSILTKRGSGLFGLTTGRSWPF